MDWTKKIEVGGKDREKILKRAEEKIGEWGMKMPEGTPPLVLDFGLGDFSKTGHIEYWIVNKEKEGYCGKFIMVFDSQTCPYHQHKIKHETFFIVKGCVRMKVNEEYIEKVEGDILEMPPGYKHSFTGIGPALLLEVSMPCAIGDNFFKDKNIGDNGKI